MQKIQSVVDMAKFRDCLEFIAKDKQMKMKTREKTGYGCQRRVIVNNKQE